MASKGKAVQRRDVEEEKLVKELQRFLSRGSTAQDDKETLLRFLSFDPVQAPITDLTPLDEMELRQEFLSEILSDIRIASNDPTRHLTALEVSTMLMLPLDSLRRISEIGESTSETIIAGAENFIKLFVKGRTPKYASAAPKQVKGDEMQQVSERLRKLSITGDGGSEAPRSNTETLKSDEVSIRRSGAGRKLAFTRDEGACIVTGTTQPEVCHIVPFAINSTEKNRGYLRELFPFVSYLLGEKVLGKVRSLLDEGLGSSDKEWNMLCLNQQLHAWWSDARWAFKLLGVIPGDEYSIVRLQFHWLSVRASEKTSTPIEMGESMKKFLESKATNFTPFAARIGLSRPVRSGDVFEVKTDPDSAQNMGLMIKIQWAALRISAMSGAAENPELLDDFEDPDSSYQVQLRKRLRLEQIGRELREDWLEGMDSSGPSTPRRRTGQPSSPVSTRAPTGAAGQEPLKRAEQQPSPLMAVTNLPRSLGLESPTKSSKSPEKGSPEKSVAMTRSATSTSTEKETQSALRERELAAPKGRENEPSR